MSSHIWNVIKFNQNTIKQGIKAFEYARQNGLDLTQTYSFVGYLLETIRQKGCLQKYSVKDQTYIRPRINIPSFFQTCCKSNHRYSKGVNSNNYLLARRKILADHLNNKTSNLSNVGKQLLGAFVSGECVELALHDWLMETGYPKEVSLLCSNKI